MFSKVRLINIQSFKDVLFEFNNEVNVFEAPNETGKSVLFKVCRKMCDANWYGRENKQDLIRRGCEFGRALFYVPKDDGVGEYIVVFDTYKTYQIYRLFDNDNQIMVWKQDFIPSEILDILGWFYDRDSDRLLNLCDQELDMPFVNSNNKSNYEAMKFILQDNDLERSKATLAEWIREVNVTLDTLGYKNSVVRDSINKTPRINIEEIQRSIEDREENIRVAKCSYSILEALDGCLNLVKPEIDIVDTDTLDLEINRIQLLRDVGVNLQNILKMERPTINKVDTQEIERLLSICKQLNNIRYNLIFVSDTLSKMVHSHDKIKNAYERIEDFEKEHEVCPLCGSIFNND